MKKKKIIVLLSALLAGCTEQAADSYITGGTTDNTDYNAAKVIESKEIRSFKISYYHCDSYDEERSGMYEYSFSQNGDVFALHALCARYEIDVDITADDTAKVQEIIDEYELVKNNGKDKVTAGLSPEYGPYVLEAEYVSGEKLFFRMTDDPYQKWMDAMTECFENILASYGYSDVLPPAESLHIISFNFRFSDEDDIYLITSEGDDEKMLLMERYIAAQDETVKEYAEITEEFLNELSAFAEEYEFDEYTSEEGYPDEVLEGYIDLEIVYESGRELNVDFNDDIPVSWQSKKEAMIAFFEDYIREHRIEME